MFTGRETKYTPRTKEHTMVVNIDKVMGSFTCVVWDGMTRTRSKRDGGAFVGTFTHGDHRIDVLVYGGNIPKATVIGLLQAFIGGKWVKMTLNEVAGGAVIPKHRL